MTSLKRDNLEAERLKRGILINRRPTIRFAHKANSGATITGYEAIEETETIVAFSE